MDIAPIVHTVAGPLDLNVLRSLEIGETAFFPDANAVTVRQQAYRLGKACGRRFHTVKTANGWAIQRAEREEA